MLDEWLFHTIIFFAYNVHICVLSCGTVCLISRNCVLSIIFKNFLSFLVNIISQFHQLFRWLLFCLKLLPFQFSVLVNKGLWSNFKIIFIRPKINLGTSFHGWDIAKVFNLLSYLAISQLSWFHKFWVIMNRFIRECAITAILLLQSNFACSELAWPDQFRSFLWLFIWK